MRITSDELDERAESLRTKIRAPGEALAVLSQNGISALLARQLANRLRVPLVPINPLLTPTEIEHILGDSAAGTLLVDSDEWDKAEGMMAGGGIQSVQLLSSDEDPLSEDQYLLYEGRTDAELSHAVIGATIIYTSGTTGKPKGCVRTAAQESARARELVASYSITKSDRQLVACPLAHSAPSIFVRAAHAVGADSIILRRFTVEGFWKRWQDQACSFFFLVPTQYRRLVERWNHQATPPLRAALVAGAPLSPQLHQRLTDWLGEGKLWQFYGSSETGSIAIAPPSAESSGSVGRLAPDVELQVRNEKGGLCQPDEIGEFFVRSPTVMSGYRPHATLDDEDGFVSVGDLGYLNPAGDVFLVDRKHDTIISGGVNVYPAEVEAVLLSHPLVEAAVVVGLEDEDWGQRVVALVACSESCSADSLREHCRATLAAYKIPKEIHFRALDEMPVGASGKPLRRMARSILLQ
jgi:long-chain acyl-CoA synthetase